MGRRGPKPKFELKELVEAAIELIDEGGLAALTMTNLAKKLGSSISGLYRYTRDRKEVYYAVQVHALSDLLSFLKAAAKRLEDGLSDHEIDDHVGALLRVVVHFDAYVEHAKRKRAEHRVLDSFLSLPDPFFEGDRGLQLKLQIDQILNSCAESMVQASNTGALAPGDSDQRTYLIWASLHGLEHFRKRDRHLPTELQVDSLIEANYRHWLKSFGADDDTLENALGSALRSRVFGKEPT